MAAPRTEVTEIVTGLAMFGAEGPREGLSCRPDGLHNVDEERWDRLGELHRSGELRQEFAAAWANGRAFLDADDGLRGRPPLLVEWKGTHRDPGDQVVPADLRVDHVYLISCKYLSRILINASPAHLFERGLAGGQGVPGGDWYQQVAPAEYQSLYDAVHRQVGHLDGLPPFVTDLTGEHRSALRERLRGRWAGEAGEAYRRLAAEVGRRSAERWREALTGKQARRTALWRLLRMGSAPYFVLGAASGRTLRLRVATPWDWRERFDLRRFDVYGDDAGQPTVRWKATVRDRRSGEDRPVEGHVEVRWSHGRFAGPPEAKVYLDTAHHRVPGYFPLR